MKRFIISMVMIALMIVPSMAIDGNLGIRTTPIAKDLSNMTLEEIRDIFSDGNMIVDQSLDAAGMTVSMKTFAKDNAEDGKGLGEKALKHAYLGSIAATMYKNRNANGVVNNSSTEINLSD